MSYPEKVVENMRLCMLRILADAPEYALPEAALAEALNQLGHRPSSDVLAAQTAWLDEMGLATRLPVGSTCIVTLLPRGLDAALARARVPGVARPRPGE